jgi:hypothetical protein
VRLRLVELRKLQRERHGCNAATLKAQCFVRLPHSNKRAKKNTANGHTEAASHPGKVFMDPRESRAHLVCASPLRRFCLAQKRKLQRERYGSVAAALPVPAGQHLIVRRRHCGVRRNLVEIRPLVRPGAQHAQHKHRDTRLER